ncbi:RSC8 [Candida pseudojiufengensis]|uniref:RSC8 n=1 Tax=Candida pseudojiufengensis TaxID=497109 RepID=UPI00222418B0|nr:RSC8 [Candida pseudojiufengensis]KAI5962159.1 RSC8 [Candida pseudojiufengensis]
MSNESPAVEPSPTPIQDDLENVIKTTTEEVKVEEPTPEIDLTKLQQEFQEKAQQYLAEQSQHIIIPTFAKWFDLTKIHQIEKKSFPDFFDDAAIYKTPNTYKYIRDFLVNTFRLNPKEYLTITSARRSLSGDVTNIIRIHQFLEKWGLINYQIDPKTKPSLLGPKFTGHFQINLDAPDNIIPYLPEDAEVITNNETKTTIEKDQPIEFNMEIRRDIYQTGEKKFDFKPQSSAHYSCSVCGKDTTEVRYHNLKIKSYSYNQNSNNISILCSICYDQGLFPSNFNSSDFVQLKKLEDSKNWTEQETLLLLEGIEMYGTHDPTVTSNIKMNINTNGQWDKISEHVGTKSREHCLKKFLQLPIEDQFLTKLVKDEPKFDKRSLIEEVVQKLIESKDGTELIQSNASINKSNSIEEQTNLIDQIVELTVEKVNIKLNKINDVQDTLIEVTNQLNKERQKNLLERWTMIDKIEKLKKEKPELKEILNDLLEPSKIFELNNGLNNNSTNKEPTIINEDNMQIDSAIDTNENTGIPLSVSKPKEYTFWSG